MEVPGDLSEFVARCADDARVYGVAVVVPELPGWTRLLVATTWDGLEPISAALPDLARLVLAEPRIERHEGSLWSGLGADDARLDVEVARISELTPDVGLHDARALLDPQGLLEQWIRWRRGRLEEEQPRDPDEGLGRMLAVDAAVRARQPLPGVGVIVDAHQVAGDDALERFYGIAHCEGFSGDRWLFETARERLACLGGEPPAFSQGFALPTFDAVEARFEFAPRLVIDGAAPLIPGVVVGVGVTPRDEIELWAAPSLRQPECGVACVADAGQRTVVARDAGIAGLGPALEGAVDAAHARIGELMEGAVRADHVPVSDAYAALEPLHLPKSLLTAIASADTRFELALATARAGEGAEPLVARKLGFAAGRLLAAD